MEFSCASSALLVLTAFACVGFVRADATACFEPLGDGRPFVMAYRGASAAYPEHSIGAYRTAIQEGARFIECDVVLSRDLVPVCRHEPNIAETTNVLTARRRLTSGAEGLGGEVVPGGGAADENSRSTATALGVTGGGTQVLASDLTLAAIKELRTVFPGHATAAAAATAAASTPIPEQQCGVGAAVGTVATGAAPGVSKQCAAEWSHGPHVASGQAGPGASQRAGEAVQGAEVTEAARLGQGGDGGGSGGGGGGRLSAESDLRVATLEDLLRMAAAADPAVGVAVHIQSAAWHNSLPQVKAQNTTFEDILLELMQRYGYAAGPYGSDAWRRRPSYLMAFEAGSLQYLALRTSSPLTQVLGPTIPDTGETWGSATSPEGLHRIRSYASSVAVARQQLLEPATATATATGSASTSVQGAASRSTVDGGRLVASELLARMREAGMQVFASVFKPRPRDHLLPGADSWEDELAPLLLGSGLQGGGEGEGGAGGPRLATIDGVFADSPAELHGVFQRWRCRPGGEDSAGM